MYRDYVLRRLYEANVARSLKGAFKRSKGMVSVIIETKPGIVLPESFFQIRTKNNASLFEGETDGTVKDGRLAIFLEKKDDYTIRREACISLSSIEPPMFVNYREKRKKEPGAGKSI